MNRPTIICSVLLACGVACAQTATPLPAFEVASIKPNTSGDHSSSTHGNRSEVAITNTTLKRLVEIAYQVRDYAFVGPDWLGSLRFDIKAKIPEGTPRDQYPLMMQALLADRFKLATHRETRMMPGFSLVAAKGGCKLQPVEGAGDNSSSNTDSNSSRGRIEAKGFSMKLIAEFLSRTLDQPVVDKTGIPGVFNFSLEYSQEIRIPPPGADAPPPDASGPSIFTALQEQLGLRLARGEKIPVEIVVVDRIERAPTEN